MADNTCIGVKTNGDRCTKRVAAGQQRCGTHMKTVETHGPNTTAIRELGYQHKKALRQLEADGLLRMNTAENDDVRNDIAEDNLHEIAFLKNRQKREVELLMRAHRNEIRRTGVDPDADANARRLEVERRRQEQLRLRQDEINALRMAIMIRRHEHNNVVENQNNNLGQALRERAQRHIRRQDDLEAFAHDNQNVHRERTVIATKEMVNIILTIPVPNEYKWNAIECSKTPGEIIVMCKLTPKAAWQMTAKYCQDESIYDLGKGIYGKVLDGVWQYILGSSDKEDLCRVLKQEMEDNIGMCAQGNLSRLCNILAGYLDGIGSQESVADILGRLMPKLFEIENLNQRLAEAFKILKDNNVPIEQWKSWLDPLVMDQDVEMSVGFLRNERDEVIGFLAVEV